MKRIYIANYSDEHIGELVALYNEHMTHLPYAWPTTVEEFRRGVIEMAAPRGHELPFDPAGLKIAMRNGEPVGYAHAVEMPGRENPSGQSRGVIYFMCVAPGDVENANALIAACSEYLASKGLGLTEIWPVAYSYWFFQGGKGEIPEDGPIAKTLFRCGCRPAAREHLMMLDLAPPVKVVGTRIPVEVKLAEVGERFRDRRFEAWVGGKLAGLVAWRVMSQMCEHPDAERIGYVSSVKTEPEFQRNRIASHLMGLVADMMRREGQEEAWLYTGFNNHPAVGMYTSVGWRSRYVASSFLPPS